MLTASSNPKYQQQQGCSNTVQHHLYICKTRSFKWKTCQDMKHPKIKLNDIQ